jgi:glutathione S-transferase
VAILRYLCRTFPVADHWYPKDSKAQAKIDAYMSWQHLNLRAFGSMYFRTKIINPMLGQPVKEESLKSFGKQLGEVLDTIENIWLKENPFIAGKELTIADLLATTELEQPGHGHISTLYNNPNSL